MVNVARSPGPLLACIELARRIGESAAAARIDELRLLEGQLMFVDSPELRFHSGIAQ